MSELTNYIKERIALHEKDYKDINNDYSLTCIGELQAVLSKIEELWK